MASRVEGTNPLCPLILVTSVLALLVLAASPWADPIGYDFPVWPPLVYGQMAIAIRAELFTSAPYGDCDQYQCGICDPGGWCPPCVPICFIPPC